MPVVGGLTEQEWQRYLDLARLNGPVQRGIRHYFLDEHGFLEVQAPEIVEITGACENFNALFALHTPRGRRFLTQTGQLHLEQTLALVNPEETPGVYTHIHSYRRERNVKDGRHLVEFMLDEPEFFCPPDEQHLDLLVGHIWGVFSSVLQHVLDAGSPYQTVQIDKDRLARALSRGYNRTTYTQAIRVLQHRGEDIRWGDDITSQHEQVLVDYYSRKGWNSDYGGIVSHGMPLVVTHYPERIKFFNMRRTRRFQNGKPIEGRYRTHDGAYTVNSCDFILPVSGESAGAAEREYDGELLTQKLLASDLYRVMTGEGIGLEDFKWYLDLVSSGRVKPHAGFGLGGERVRQYLIAERDIRQASSIYLGQKLTGLEPVRAAA